MSRPISRAEMKDEVNEIWRKCQIQGEEHMNGIPNKNGMVRFYVIGRAEGASAYLGWYDMTDWNEGWKKVWADAENEMCLRTRGNVEFEVLRHDQLEDLSHNVQSALFEAMEDPDPLPWVGLTKEEAKEISMANRPYVIGMIAALEARLKEKNT
jgi:hypothetical protein